MDIFNKAVIIGVNLRDLEGPPAAQNIFAEVVLIDKTNGILHPLLYQLRTETLIDEADIATIRHHGVAAMEDNTFAMVGEVVSINKTKKQIYLKNEVTVTYRYLILASGLKQSLSGVTHDEELSAGLSTLMEAIRVRKKFSNVLQDVDFNSYDAPKREKSGLQQIKPFTKLSLQKIENILKPHVLPESHRSLEMILAGTEKRLYEVQL